MPRLGGNVWRLPQRFVSGHASKARLLIRLQQLSVNKFNLTHTQIMMLPPLVKASRGERKAGTHLGVVDRKQVYFPTFPEADPD